jgi:hypothetical protein
MKNPLLVAARNAVMKYTNIPGNDLKRIHDYDAHDEMQIYLAYGDLRHINSRNGLSRSKLVIFNSRVFINGLI